MIYENECSEFGFDPKNRKFPSSEFDVKLLSHFLGDLISEGFYSLVFSKTKQSKTVTILSLEKEKFLFYSELFRNTEIEIQLIRNTFSKYFFHVFEITRLEEVHLGFEINRALYDVSEEMTPKFIDIDLISIERLESNLNFHLGELDLSRRLRESIIKSIRILKKCQFKKKVRLDLKSEQFLEDKLGNIYCIDPVVFI